MRTARYSIPSMQEGKQALSLDLANSMTVLDGVAHVDVDRDAHAITVHFDPDYMDLKTLAYYIAGCGYPIDGEPRVT